MTMTQLSMMTVFGLLILLTSACQSWTEKDPHQGSKPTVEAIYVSAHCGRSQTTPKATWIDDAGQLEASIRQIRTDTLGGKPIKLPALDFQHEVALLVEMGQQPTLGYRLELAGEDNLRILQDQAQLTLNWLHPPADALVAQALSSPCLLIKLDRGSYTSIQVLDRQGAIKTSTH